MCAIDVDDPCEIWRDSSPRARKQHRCCVCSTTIQVGEQYLALTYGGRGEMTTDRACAVCAVMWRDFRDAHGAAYNPATFTGDEGLGGCVERYQPWFAPGTPRSLSSRLKWVASLDDDDRKWRTYLAIILRRQLVVDGESARTSRLGDTP